PVQSLFRFYENSDSENHMKWREEVGFDSVKFWEVPQGLKDLLPEQIIGFDH
ncbi:unnamed protein product, partial [Allacma fusca]